MLKLAAKDTPKLKIISILPEQPSLDLWEPICLKGNATASDVLLLLPEEYSFLDRAKAEADIPKVRDILCFVHQTFDARCAVLITNTEIPLPKQQPATYADLYPDASCIKSYRGIES